MLLLIFFININLNLFKANGNLYFIIFFIQNVDSNLLLSYNNIWSLVDISKITQNIICILCCLTYISYLYVYLLEN